LHASGILVYSDCGGCTIEWLLLFDRVLHPGKSGDELDVIYQLIILGLLIQGVIIGHRQCLFPSSENNSNNTPDLLRPSLSFVFVVLEGFGDYLAISAMYNPRYICRVFESWIRSSLDANSPNGTEFSAGKLPPKKDPAHH